ncbi:MAG: prepilin-type N-terminal cleavage/methylation domain-containing protein [Verrucomicrobiota bacterium]
MINRKSNSGLTLIEVMLAMAILAIGLVVLVAAASRCLAVIKATEIYQNARELIARVELENPLILEEEIEETSDRGNFTGKFRGYSWQRDIILISEEEDGLFEVHTKIFWTEKGKKRFEDVVTYIYSPPLDDDLQ